MGQDELKNALLTTNLGRSLSELELQTLIAHSKIVNFEPGDVIVRQGKILSGMYVIINGIALVTAKVLGEGGTYIATLKHGNLAGEVSLIEKNPSAITIIASTKVNCLLISNNYFSILELIFPETKFKLSWAIANEVGMRIKNVYERIITFISQNEMIVRSVFQEVIKSFTKPTSVRLSENEIATLRQESLFKDFNDEIFELLLQHSEVYRAPKNCTLINEEDHDETCYIVLRGAVQSSIIKNNKIAKLSVIGPTRLIANLAIASNTFTSIANYSTCERSLLLKISAANLKKIQDAHQNLWFLLFDLICKSYVGLEHALDKLDIRLHSEFYNR